MIFFSYGMQKSASSFVFQMTFNAAETLEKPSGARVRYVDDLFVGFKRSRFAEEILNKSFGLDRPKDTNQEAAYLDYLFDCLLERLDEQSGDMIVLKTHLPCSPKIADAIKRGIVLASATFRHPAEMILSRRDMAKRDGEVLPSDLRPLYKKIVKDFYSWVEVPQVRRYYYDDITLNPFDIVSDIFDHIGSSADFSKVLDRYLADRGGKILQFNKGVINRAAEEMSSDELRTIERDFSGFIEFINQHKEATAAALNPSKTAR